MAYITVTRPAVERAVVAIAGTADGRRFVSARGEGKVSRIEVWDGRDGRLLRTLTDATGVVRSVALSRDGRRVVSLASPGRAICWDVESGAEIEAADSVEVVQAPMAPALAELRPTRSPEGLLALSHGAGGALRIWDLESGQLLRTASGSPPPGRILALAPGACLAVCGDEAHGTGVWDVISGVRLYELARPGARPPRVEISRDGRSLVAFRGREVEIRELESGEIVSRPKVGRAPSYVSALALTPDGKRALVGGSDGALVVWRLPSGPAETRFLADSPIRILTARSSTISLGTALGTVYLLRIEHAPVFAPAVAGLPTSKGRLRYRCAYCDAVLQAPHATFGGEVACGACGSKLEVILSPGWD